MRAEAWTIGTPRGTVRVMSAIRQIEMGGWTATLWHPGSPLREVFDEAWIVRGGARFGTVRIPPDPGVQFVINLGDPYVMNGVARREAWIEGIWEGAMNASASGATHLMGVRFQPWGAARVLGEIAGECVNQVVDAESALGPRIAALRQRLLDARDDEARFQVLAGFLSRQIHDRRRDVEAAMRLLARSGGRASIDAVAPLRPIDRRTQWPSRRGLGGLRARPRLLRPVTFDQGVAVAGWPQPRRVRQGPRRVRSICRADTGVLRPAVRNIQASRRAGILEWPHETFDLARLVPYDGLTCDRVGITGDHADHDLLAQPAVTRDREEFGRRLDHLIRDGGEWSSPNRDYKPGGREAPRRGAMSTGHTGLAWSLI